MLRYATIGVSDRQKIHYLICATTPLTLRHASVREVCLTVPKLATTPHTLHYATAPKVPLTVQNVVQLHLPFTTPQLLTVQKCATTTLTLCYYSTREVRLTVPKNVTFCVQESTLPHPIPSLASHIKKINLG
jgi:hypothetical protein